MPFPRAHLTWVAVAFTFWAWGYHFVLETCFIIHQLYLLRGCNYLFLFKWNLESKRINVLSDILFYVMLVFKARLLTLHSSTLVFSRTLSSPAYSHSTLYIPIQSSKPQFRHTLSVQPFFFSIFNSPCSFPRPIEKIIPWAVHTSVVMHIPSHVFPVGLEGPWASSLLEGPQHQA